MGQIHLPTGWAVVCSLRHSRRRGLLLVPAEKAHPHENNSGHSICHSYRRGSALETRDERTVLAMKPFKQNPSPPL